MLCLPALQLVNATARSKKSSQPLKAKTLPRLVFFAARKERQFWNCFPAISRRSTALSFVSKTRNAPSPIRPAILIISENGTRFPPMISSKFLSTAMRLRGKRFGLMPTHSRSTGQHFLTSMLTSWETQRILRVRRHRT
jgi:hypothetical protein